VLGGYDLATEYPELGAALLVCATETRTSADIEHCAAVFASAMRQVKHAS
jgi:glycine dehydrogenase subunit 1